MPLSFSKGIGLNVMFSAMLATKHQLHDASIDKMLSFN